MKRWIVVLAVLLSGCGLRITETPSPTVTPSATEQENTPLPSQTPTAAAFPGCAAFPCRLSANREYAVIRADGVRLHDAPNVLSTTLLIRPYDQKFTVHCLQYVMGPDDVWGSESDCSVQAATWTAIRIGSERYAQETGEFHE